MKTTFTKLCHTMKTVSTAVLISSALVSTAFAGTAVVDAFDSATQNSYGFDRIFMTDAMAGGGSQSETKVHSGVMHVTGKITPPRGQPGWASSVLPLAPMGEAPDLSEYQGVRLLVKLNSGSLSLSANSNEVTNFDYHAAQVVLRSDGEFHEVKVPFDSMKRMWSEQTALNPKTVNSLSIVAFGLQPGEFDFELDEVSFY